MRCKRHRWHVLAIVAFSLLIPRMAFAFDVRDALYFDQVAQNYQLTEVEITRLQNQGFVVITDEQRQFDSFGRVFMDVFHKDLPVFITTDAILHAVHLAFDEMLQGAEQAYLYRLVYDMLGAVHRELPEKSAPEEVKDDVDLYLSVARSLLVGRGQDPQASPDIMPPSIMDNGKSFSLRGQEETVQKILDAIENHDLIEDFPLYGRARDIDFSQFIPRGHYTASHDLRRYFMTMMWMGREDLGFLLFHKGNLNQDDPGSYQHQMMDAYLMLQLIQESGQWGSKLQ